MNRVQRQCPNAYLYVYVQFTIEVLCAACVFYYFHAERFGAGAKNIRSLYSRSLSLSLMVNDAGAFVLNF